MTVHSKSLSTKEFIEKATKLHADKYDYSETIYVNTKTNVIIICKKFKHKFEMQPTNHLQGQGCGECKKIENREKSMVVNKDKFLNDMAKKYNGKFDYSKMNYIDSRTKITIICTVDNHGEFYQTPSCHNKSQNGGCPECAKKSTGDKLKMDIVEFTKRANEAHGNKYDYSKAVYINSYTEIIIICKRHGEFIQLPNNHVSKATECPECYNEKRRGLVIPCVKMECCGRDRNDNPCRNHAIGENDFCEFHQYMKDYTAAMLASLSQCSGCKMMYYLSDSKVCQKCKERGKIIRQKANEDLIDIANDHNEIIEVEPVILCKYGECIRKKSDENLYCYQHQRYHFKETVEAQGKRVCSRFDDHCREIVEPDSKYLQCQKCRDHDTERAQRKKEKAKNVEHGENTKVCESCLEAKDLDEFISENKQPTNKCDDCRGQQKEYDFRSRKKRIGELGLDAYREKNAKDAANYRENNPETYEDCCNHKKYSNVARCTYYKDRATKSGIPVELTDTEFVEYFNDICFYCGREPDETELNGIDRVDNNDGYNICNCVSCCKHCNYMKNSLGVYIFVERCKYILIHKGLIKENQIPSNISDTARCGYLEYERRTEKRGMELFIDEDEFNKIISGDCYICGKKNSKTHQNGIDRYDNNIGYVFENCKPCCGECNYMKKNLDYDFFINHLVKIYNYCFTRAKDENESIMSYHIIRFMLNNTKESQCANSIIQNNRSIIKSRFIKMTKPELEIYGNIKKENRDDKMIKKYDLNNRKI
jgi:hypothetical protein